MKAGTFSKPLTWVQLTFDVLLKSSHSFVPKEQPSCEDDVHIGHNLSPLCSVETLPPPPPPPPPPPLLLIPFVTWAKWCRMHFTDSMCRMFFVFHVSKLVGFT